MSSLSNLSILIVDPNPGMRGSLQNMLYGASITQVDYALSAGTAIRALTKKTFDVILCEYDLDAGGENGQDGQQLLEDLRHHRIIDPSAIFIMLTSEGVHSKVMGAAELQPTDYVLKPFTADGLLGRISRAVERRNALLPVYRATSSGQLRDAIAACVGGALKHPRHAGVFIRLRAALHEQLGEWADAERIYRELEGTRQAGWVQLGLARCQLEQDHADAAQATLEALIDTNPRLMAAYDLLARSHEAQGQPAHAKRVLADAVAVSPHVVRRLRRLGELALDEGDMPTAEKAFRQVVAKAKYSEFRDPQDHVNLVRTLVRRGDGTGASSVIRDLDRSMRASPATEACRAFAAGLVQELAGNAPAAATELAKAAAAVQAALELAPAFRRDLVHACLRHRLDDDAATVVLTMMNEGAGGLTADQAGDVLEAAGRHDLAVEVRRTATQQVDALVADAAERLERGDHRGAVAAVMSAVRRTPGSAPVLLAAVRTALRQLDELGWEAPLGEQTANMLARLRAVAPDHPLLDSLAAQYVATQRKYGIAG
jgi:DNA-binding NarL/FixJ family response regulator/Tfp pilus assembly protein PilF